MIFRIPTVSFILRTNHDYRPASKLTDMKKYIFILLVWVLIISMADGYCHPVAYELLKNTIGREENGIVLSGNVKNATVEVSAEIELNGKDTIILDNCSFKSKVFRIDQSVKVLKISGVVSISCEILDFSSVQLLNIDWGTHPFRKKQLIIEYTDQYLKPGSLKMSKSKRAIISMMDISQ